MRRHPTIAKFRPLINARSPIADDAARIDVGDISEITVNTIYFRILEGSSGFHKNIRRGKIVIRVHEANHIGACPKNSAVDRVVDPSIGFAEKNGLRPR